MFTIEWKSEESELLLTIEGDIDLGTIDRFRRQLASVVEAGHTHVALDASRVQYIYSEGLEVILSLSQQLEARGGGLRLLHPSERLQRLMQITRLYDVISAEI